MNPASTPDLRYPTGKFHRPRSVTPSERAEMISAIAALPAELRAAVEGLDEQQLDTPYRPDGWTVRQVVHHLADSHINSYVRFKLALTESTPTVKGYDEALWAELPEARQAPLEISLALLDALHRRWTLMLGAMSDEDFSRTFEHSEHGEIRLDVNTALYAWHGRHHVAHITALRDRMNWG